MSNNIFWTYLHLCIFFCFDQSNDKNGCSEFLSYEIELRKRGSQNDVTLRLENIYRNSSFKPLTRLHKILN